MISLLVTCIHTKLVRIFLNGAIKIVHTAPWSHYPHKNVFSDCQNLLYDKSASFRCDGRLFHSPGPAAVNALSPKVLYVTHCCWWLTFAWAGLPCIYKMWWCWSSWCWVGVFHRWPFVTSVARSTIAIGELWRGWQQCWRHSVSLHERW